VVDSSIFDISDIKHDVCTCSMVLVPHRAHIMLTAHLHSAQMAHFFNSPPQFRHDSSGIFLNHGFIAVNIRLE
jgi:hypothetical protein